MKKKTEGASSQKVRDAEVASLVSALLPLADLCIKSGYGVGHLVVAAKMASISVASLNSRIGNRLNHSRIAAITGLTRKEVRALTRESSKGSEAPVGHSQGQRTARVIEGWKTDPVFLTDSGSPAVLTVRGDNATFPNLVRRYAGDVTPVAVLKELQRLGVVSKTRENSIRLVKASLRSPTLGSERIARFAERMRTIGVVLMREVEAPQSVRSSVFETSAELGQEEAALFLSLFSERAADLIDGAERWYGGETGRSKKGRKPIPNNRQKVSVRVIVSAD